MATFIIRPELNYAEDGDYERLHDAMYSRQIYKVIKLTTDNTWRDLPTGTYRGVFPVGTTSQQVYDIAVSALNSIGKFNLLRRRDFEIIVFKSNGSTSDLVLNTDKSKLPPGS